MILVMSFAFLARGWWASAGQLISDIAPKGLGGLTGGLFNLAPTSRGSSPRW
ncbi:hypothetical protein LNQ52_22550 [Klebsiella pneumoniae subsp. pneumoniae]|nr:hypothetical protein [Klebsiella pneumoniae subsp. pneumoniae]